MDGLKKFLLLHLQPVNCNCELFSGVLTRCLRSLEQKDFESSKSTETSDALKEVYFHFRTVVNILIEIRCERVNVVKTVL